MTLVLASTSASRRAMLTAAGVPHIAEAPLVDEDELKAALASRSPRDLADALAEAKAVRVSLRHQDAMVLGADQLLVSADGRLFDKPATRAAAAAQLAALSGTTHILLAAAVIAEAGRATWRHIGVARVTMRPLSSGFIDDYLTAEGDAVLASVGAYLIEGRGCQLFERVRGDHFSIRGLPLLALLAHLRARGIMPA